MNTHENVHLWQNLFVEKETEYRGYVRSIHDADSIVRQYETEMNAKFVIHFSRYTKFGETGLLRSNHRIYWDLIQRPTNTIDFDPVIFFSASDESCPYIHVNNRDFLCQYGEDMQVAKKLKYRENISINEGRKLKRMRGRVNIISKKFGCPAMIKMKEIILFPTYKLPRASEWKRRIAAKSLKESMLEGKKLEFERRIYIRLPKESTHCNHPNSIKTGVETMYSALIDKPGPADKIYIDEMSRPDPHKNTVLIKVAASSVNRDDTLQRQGQLPPLPGASRGLGIEASGTVVNAGPKCKKEWEKGMKVMACCNGGGNSEYVCVSEDHIMHVPSHMTLGAAAAIPQVWLTAYDLLHNVGKLKAGDTVLIHAGASGVGTAAIQLVNLAGAKAIVTTSTQEKIDLCKKLGAVDGFNYKTDTFADSILQLTKGGGVNIILDCVGETHWEHNARVIATEGYWIVYGVLSGPNVNGPLFDTILNKRITIKGVKLRASSHKYKTDLISSFSEKILPHFAPTSSLPLSPIVNRIFPLSKVGEAHRYMESNHCIGKIILDIQGDGNSQGIPNNQELEAAETIQAIAQAVNNLQPDTEVVVVGSEASHDQNTHAGENAGVLQEPSMVSEEPMVVASATEDEGQISSLCTLSTSNKSLQKQPIQDVCNNQSEYVDNKRTPQNDLDSVEANNSVLVSEVVADSQDIVYVVMDGDARADSIVVDCAESNSFTIENSTAPNSLTADELSNTVIEILTSDHIADLTGTNTIIIKHTDSQNSNEMGEIT